MQPEITVVVPSYNRRASLSKVMDGLERQDLEPGRFDVVVVLDGSSDGSAEMLSGRGTPFALRVIEQANAGPAAARNRGVADVTAPFCLFIDDDMELAPALVREHLAAQSRAGGALVMGRIDTVAVRRGFPSYEVRFWELFHAARARGEPLAPPDCFSGNMSMPVAAFREAGGFDTTLLRSEDVELALRLTRVGLPVRYAGDARVRQLYDKTTAQILRDHDAYGRATIQLFEKYPPYLLRSRVWTLAGRRGLAGEAARAAIGVPVPMWLLSALGQLSPSLPGVTPLFHGMRTHQMHRGARAAVNDRKRWDAMTTGVRILAYGPDVAAGELRAHMRWLRAHGVTTIGIGELVARRNAGALSQRFTVAIAVEGSEASQRELGPVFEEFDCPWVLFAADGAATMPAGGWPEAGVTADSPCEASRAMARAGVRFASYAQTRCDETERAALVDARCTAALSTRRGFAGMRADPLSLPRLAVPPGLSAAAFGRLVRYGRPFRLLPFSRSAASQRTAPRFRDRGWP